MRGRSLAPMLGALLLFACGAKESAPPVTSGSAQTMPESMSTTAETTPVPHTTSRPQPAVASQTTSTSSPPTSSSTTSPVEPPPSTLPPVNTTTVVTQPPSPTGTGSRQSLGQILERREAWVISNSDYTVYSIEPCWTRGTGELPPYGIFQSDPVDLAAVVGAGDVFICSIGTEPVGEPGNLLVAVLTDDGLVATHQSSSGEGSLPFTAPQGLSCQEFVDLPDIAAWIDHESYADWGPGAAYRLVVAYWFVENQPERMDPDGDAVPCEEVVSSEVIAAAWSGDF